MTRADTRIPPHGIIKQNSTAVYLLRSVLVALLVFLLFGASIILKKPVFLVEDTQSEQNIPKTYGKLEGVDPEERDLFHGFRTSFLPAEEVMLAQRHSQRNLGGDNEPSDNFIWGLWDEEIKAPSRPKRMSSLLFTSDDDNSREKSPPSHHHGIVKDAQDSTDGSDEDYDSEESSSEQENEGIESIVRHKVDRGPLDDVVEQIRGQPELEEGEIESAAHLYKPAPRHIGTHAFWKGQGDKDTIRHTQASSMKRNMDLSADPCEDFYQYACGNWASLNPIPADKAGYDTFEMLRENLDIVLRELLEFNQFDQHFGSNYPGAHLDMNYFSLNNIRKWKPKSSDKLQIVQIDAIKANNHEILNNTDDQRYRYHWTKLDEEKTKIVNHLHSLVKRRTKTIAKVSNATKSKGMRYVKHKTVYNLRKSDVVELQRNRRKKSEAIIPVSNTVNNKLQDKRIIQLLRNKRRRSLKRKLLKTKSVARRKLKLFPAHKSRPKRHSNVNYPDDLSGGDAALKAKFLFVSCMNYEILQKRGHQPLLDLLHLLGGWPILNKSWTPDGFDWLELMVKLRLYNNDILISEWVGPDIKNSDEYVIQFDQTSLGLPTRDYFLQDSNEVYLNAYKDYLIKIANLLGGDREHVLYSANELINFEIKLASITSAPEDRRNVSELYRRMTLHKLEKLVPEIKWRRYLCGVMDREVQLNESVVLFALTYVRHLVKLINKTEPRILANYLLWRFVRHRVNNLDDRFQSAKQQFYFILFGREQSPPRWKNCVSQVNSNMGMALGSMFVKKHFDETSKNDTLTMTTELQQSFIELLQNINWIDDGTKNLAAEKVDRMMLRIGYPDFILNKKELDERYKDVIIHPDKYFENILNILQHLTETEQARIGQPVNKTLWNTAPAVVNAYYSRNKNQIMFPAGILQPPFYHRHFPKSLNYGGIGVVIGHEITHGFDDKGRLFDCNGNLHRWWSDAAIEAFHQRAQCLIDQYGRYVVPEVNMKLDGMNTQGENIADNGGVKQAFRAYTHWVEKHGIEDETLPGLNHTHTQLFFLNFAQVWCGAMRSEAMRNKLKTAVHSPGRFRVIGTLSNSFDFAREFQCPLGSPMNPVEKCAVW